MFFFNKISIKYKIILIILFTNLVIVFIGVTLESYYLNTSLKVRHIEDTKLYTNTTGQLCASTFDFNYPDDAKRVLKDLKSAPNIKHAFLYDVNKKLFAKYHSTDSKKIKIPPLTDKIAFFINDTLFVQQNIQYANVIVGYIITVTDTKISEELRERHLILAFAFLGLIAIAILLASYMQKFISVPIIKLSEAVNSISVKKDYSIRVENIYEDEIGTLKNRINNFLNVIQNREIERNKAELALRISEERFRSLAELLPETVFEVNSSLDFTFINNSAKTTFNYSDEEIENLNFRSIIASSDEKKLESSIKDLLKNGKTITSEYIALKKNGEQFPALTYVSPVYTGKTLSGFRGILIDFSDLKKAQNQIKELNKHLEQRVIERTEKLATANKELADVSYISAHDLKTPIRGISQLASWIIEDHAKELTPELSESINLIENRAKHMNKLVDGILEYTDIGRVNDQPEKFNLNEIIKNLKNNKFNKNNISIEIIGGSTPLTYQKKHLSQIFAHLIENSIKFNTNEQVKITITIEDELDKTTFTIKDNGIGIDKKYYKRIFGIFKTLSSDYNNQNIGIGLALVKKIIELYGGEISIVNSTEKIGTEISFTLKGLQNLDL